MSSNDRDGGGSTCGSEAAASTGGEGGEGREAAPKRSVRQRRDLSLALGAAAASPKGAPTWFAASSSLQVGSRNMNMAF
jgi:hypothetical protein